MELSRERHNTVSIQETKQSLSSEQPSKLEQIVKLLKHFGVRRQAKLDTADYLVFASDLETFDLRDIEQSLNTLKSRPRRDGETAFPDSGTLEQAVRDARKVRYASEDKANKEREDDRMRKFLKDHPEECKPDAEMKAYIDKLSEKFNITKPKEITIAPPVLRACPHCSKELPVAPNIRFWSAKEGRDYFDTLEEVQRIAAVNREASAVASAEDRKTKGAGV